MFHLYFFLYIYNARLLNKLPEVFLPYLFVISLCNNRVLCLKTTNKESKKIRMVTSDDGRCNLTNVCALFFLFFFSFIKFKSPAGHLRCSETLT